MFRLKPKDARFYDNFDRAAGMVVEAAEQYVRLLDNLDNPDNYVREIKRLEHAVDEIVHDTMELLHRSFITPLEREDIHLLIAAVDTVIDLIDDAAARIVIYKITDVFQEAPPVAQLLVEATREVQKAIGEIRHIKKQNDILKHCVEISRFENLGDAAHTHALGVLFEEFAQDPLAVIKWKEILEHIEEALDRCEEISDIVEGIVLENS